MYSAVPLPVGEASLETLTLAMAIFPAEVAMPHMQQSDLRPVLSGSAMNTLMAFPQCKMLDNTIQMCKIHI